MKLKKIDQLRPLKRKGADAFVPTGLNSPPKVALCEMAIVTALLFVFVSTVLCSSPPSSTDYINVHQMEARGLVPYLTPALPPFSNDRIRQNGQTFFGGVPTGQNATCLALCVYDWSQPHYQRIQLLQIYLVDQNNPVGLARAVFQAGRASSFFGIDGSGMTSDKYVALFMSQLNVVRTFVSEIVLLRYALAWLPVPTVQRPLYHGFCPSNPFFCQSIGVFNNITSTDCLLKYFAPGQVLSNAEFWSTTLDIVYARQYSCNYILMISPAKLSLGRNISSLAIAGDEYLFPPGAKFNVTSSNNATGTVIYQLIEL